MISLATPIDAVPKISKRIVPALKRLGIKTIRDLLLHFPSRYEDFSNVKKIREVVLNETVTIIGTIQRISTSRTIKKRMFLTEALIRDSSGTIKALWFNQPFMARNLRSGTAVSLSGKAVLGKGGLYLQNPAYERSTKYEVRSTESSRSPTSRGPSPAEASAREGGKSDFNGSIHTAGLVSIYPETKGITSRWLRYLVKSFIELRKIVPDPLPPETRNRYILPEIKQALFAIHFPNSPKEAKEAERRFAFEELLLVQLRALKERSRLKQHRAPSIPLDLELIKQFVRSLPFALTDAQRRSIWEITNDLAKPRPMNRLLEGDVGSGKTVVAACAALLVGRAGYQTAFMAPTEILARQHYKTLHNVLAAFGAKIGLLTGSEKKSEADTQIIIGTHALIQKNVKFDKLGLVIVDEQHRFGVEQRAALIRGQTRTRESQTNADKLLYENLTYKIRGCIFEIKNSIGIGHKEAVYQKALAEAFRSAGLNFIEAKPIIITFNGKRVGMYQPDFIVEDKVIVELKALPFLGTTEKRQLWTYVKGSEYKVALLVNFGPHGAEIRRIVYDIARSPRKSALTEESPRESAALIPHFLSMSATPIPRTLALTVYGDLDLSILDEMPKSRKSVITKIVEPAKREEAYQFIRDEIKKEKQVFVICPRIEIPNPIPDSIGDQIPNKFQIRSPIKSETKFQMSLLLAEVKSVKEEHEKLSKHIFPDLRVGMLHGKMKPKEKEAAMRRFREKEIDILVSTSVVEVGVDIPNATIMMIEGAERFGLAQLHQFRGRVGRGVEQSYCFLFPTENGMVTRRLRAVVEAKTGFELAEKDLEIRGPGELFGTRQWGVSDWVLKGLSDPALVREVRGEARELIKKSPDLLRYPVLYSRLLEFEKTLHLE